MKNIKLWPAILLLITFTACSKDTPENTPAPGNNNKSEKSIRYSGTLITDTDKSGYFDLELKESNSTAKVTIDGKLYTLKSNAPLTPGEAIQGFAMSDGTNSITINADKDWRGLGAAFAFSGFTIYPIAEEDTDEEKVENYTGWSHSTFQSDKADYVYVMTIKGNKFTTMEKLTGGSGIASTITGTVVKTATDIKFSYVEGGDNVNFTMHRSADGNTLSFNDSGPDNYTLVITLTKAP